MVLNTKIQTLLFSLSLSLVFVNHASAAELGRLQEGSLAVSPFLIEMEVAPGRSVGDSIEIFNTSDGPKKLTYSIQDFMPAGERGQVMFLPVNEISRVEYSLSPWIRINTQPEFTIPPYGSTKVEFEVTAPVDAPSGSKYAGILFSFEDESASGGNVMVARKLGVLVIARNGRGRPEAELEAGLKRVYTESPPVFLSTFHNTGNVHLSPKGEYYIYNWLGRLVKTVPINRDANLILPKTARIFDSPVNKFLLGRYKIETLIYYGSEPKLEVRHEAVVWIFPVVKVAGGIMLVLGILVSFYLVVKGYTYLVVRHYRKFNDKK